MNLESILADIMDISKRQVNEDKMNTSTKLPSAICDTRRVTDSAGES